MLYLFFRERSIFTAVIVTPFITIKFLQEKSRGRHPMALCDSIGSPLQIQLYCNGMIAGKKGRNLQNESPELIWFRMGLSNVGITEKINQLNEQNHSEKLYKRRNGKFFLEQLCYHPSLNSAYILFSPHYDRIYLIPPAPSAMC